MNRPQLLVTGGAVRIGAAIARGFGAAGWHVVIHHRNSHEEAEALAAELPSARTVEGDFADPKACVTMIEELAEELDDWRVLINCAAVFPYDDARALDLDRFDIAMAVNARAPVLLAQSFLRKARSQAGRCVINITDQKLHNPNPDFFSYTMSKHALGAATRMLAMGACGDADRVYALAPGAILPSHDQREEETEISHRLNLLKRKTAAEEIAEACLFLSQKVLRNGETVFVDSGQHLLSQPRDVIYLARGETA